MLRNGANLVCCWPAGLMKANPSVMAAKRHTSTLVLFRELPLLGMMALASWKHRRQSFASRGSSE
jgi:hypothetical protein